ncbi:MAG: hypothetical protein JXB62_02655 [Pirellulales bacterium]|nr:hypothetical protein [Pirellulales bacterium]
MIAPIRQKETRPRPPGIRRAYRLVASTLLSDRPRRGSQTPWVPAWQAWLYTGWVVIVVGAYAASMLGWI